MASEMATSTTIYINARWYVLFFYVSTTTGARRSSCSPQTDLTELTRRLFQHVWSFPRRRRRRRTSFLHRLSCRRLTFASHHPPFHSRRILNISRFLHTFTYILNATPSTFAVHSRSRFLTSVGRVWFVLFPFFLCCRRITLVTSKPILLIFVFDENRPPSLKCRCFAHSSLVKINYKSK